MTDREELKRFAAVVRQYVNSQYNYAALCKAWPGESRAARQAMLNGLKYVEKLTSDNSEYVRNCKPGEHDIKGSWEYRQCKKCGEFVAVG